jgi:MFS family permease
LSIEQSQDGPPAELEQSPPRTNRASWAFIAVYALGYAGTWLALLTPVLVSIALRLRQLAPESATQDLALVLSLGAIFAIVGNPIFGHLSDRTRSRFGRRRPWLIGGMLCGGAALALTALAESVTGVLIGWCLAQLAFNAVLAAMVAILPDQIPESQRGTVSGIIAVCLPLGQALGVLVVRGVSTSTMLSFMLPALIGTAAVLLLAWVLPDRPIAEGAAGSPSLRETIRSFWVDPRLYPDFTWACLSRFLLSMGSAFIAIYQPFYFIERLGLPDSEIAGRISNAVLIQTAMIVVFSIASGRFSDLLRRRKPFVFTGGVLYALGLWMIANAATYESFVFGMAVTGVGHGLYFGTDLALVTGILRSRRENSGKDLGVLNVANTLPQCIAPALGSFVLVSSGGDYTSMFIVAGCAALLSSAAILPLRSVR